MTAPIQLNRSSTAYGGTELCEGIYRLPVSDAWVSDLHSTRTVLESHFDLDSSTAVLPPSPEPDRLRYTLMKNAPELAHIGSVLMKQLEGPAAVVIVPELHIIDLPVPDRQLLLYALSVIMGYPTGTDPREHKVVWPVTARAKSGKYFATYSELDSEAEYHTDAQYYPDPERYFFLYVNHAARCGGGVSRARSNQHIIRYLERSSEGRKALATLRNRLYPFRIPSAYTESGTADEVRYTYAPILTDEHTIRWRRDTLEKALRELPDFDSAEVEDAIRQLIVAFDEAPGEYRHTLPDDSLILVDNHRAVHARTAFEDHDRFLFRVRFHNKQHVR